MRPLPAHSSVTGMDTCQRLCDPEVVNVWVYFLALDNVGQRKAELLLDQAADTQRVRLPQSDTARTSSRAWIATKDNKPFRQCTARPCHHEPDTVSTLDTRQRRTHKPMDQLVMTADGRHCVLQSNLQMRCSAGTSVQSQARIRFGYLHGFETPDRSLPL